MSSSSDYSFVFQCSYFFLLSAHNNNNSMSFLRVLMRASLVADMSIERMDWKFQDEGENYIITPRVYKNIKTLRRVFQANMSVHLSTRLQPLMEEELLLKMP